MSEQKPPDWDDDAETPRQFPGDRFDRAPWFAFAKIEFSKHVRERHGEIDDPRIQEYLASVGFAGAHDEIPWCSAFVNWCMQRCGAVGTGKANARSWLDWGVELKQPKAGCVVVFSRPPDPTHGHVAFYIDETPSSIHCLGGNQSNSVSFAYYPRTRLLGYRWPKETA